MDITALIGCISGSISLVAVIYFVGVWRGQVDSDRRYFRDCITNYPPAEIHTMVKTLWKVYVLDALHNRPDLATRSSDYKLKPNAENLIPEAVKVALLEIPKELVNDEDVVTGYLVVRTLGLGSIEVISKKQKLSIQETIAILSTFLENNNEKTKPS